MKLSFKNLKKDKILASIILGIFIAFLNISLGTIFWNATGLIVICGLVVWSALRFLYD